MSDEFRFNFLDYYDLTREDIMYIVLSLTLIIDQERMRLETEQAYQDQALASYSASDWEWEERTDAYWIEKNK